MQNDKCIRIMRKTLFVVLAMCSTLLVYAQEGTPVLPKKVKVGKPAILEHQPCKLEELKNVFCAERKWGTKKTASKYWIVYSDRSHNVLYSDANKTRKLEATLAFKQEVVIADVQGDMALVYEDRSLNLDHYPMISQDKAKWLGWVPMDHLLLWNKCPTDRRGVQYKALLSMNLNEMRDDFDKFKGKYYEHPENDNNPKDLHMDMSFYFIMKESDGRALLANSPTIGERGLFGWVDYSAFSRWNQRACLEPNWSSTFVQNHKGEDVALYFDKDLKVRATRWEYGKSNGDVESWYEYRMDPAQFRFPILDKVEEGDESIHCTAFSRLSGGKVNYANYDEGNREVTEDVEQIRKMRGRMNLIFVVEATTEMNGIFPAIKESIKKCEGIAGQGLNVKVGAVLYRGAAQGASGIETVALTNYDDPLLNKKLEAKNANGKITDKNRDVALSLALEKAADAEAMGYNKDHNTLLLIVGSRGAPEDDRTFESSQLLDKLLENNVQVMSIQVVRSITGSWVNFNEQMRTLIKKNVQRQYEAIGDKPKFNPTEGGYNFYSEKNSSDESVLFAEYRYSKELGKALSPAEVTSYIDSGINKFAEISEKWADHFEEALGDIEFDPQFLERHLTPEGYQQWKKVKAISALEGYTELKAEDNQKYWKYILYLSGDELKGLTSEMKQVYEIAKEGSGDRKPYINAMKAIIKSHLGQNDDEKIDKKSVEELQELLYGLNVHNDDREYNYTLEEIQDPRVVSSVEYQTILDDFVKKYERLDGFRKNYRYKVKVGEDYYYWIPIEELPY